MSNIKITADSTCDLPRELVEKHGIIINPLYTVLGDKSLLDGVEATPEDIYDFVEKNSQLPKTSAGSVDDYLTLFKKYTDEGFEVVHISLSSSLSSSYQNACIAAAEIGGVYVVDSLNLSTGTGLLVLDAVDMANEGESAQNIAKALTERAPLVRASFVLDKLDYMVMGGRCSGVAMLGANLLKIKPVIAVGTDGKLSMVDKPRGQYAKALEKYVASVLNQPNINTKRVFVTHTKCDDEIVSLVKDLVKNTVDFKELIESTAGCVITSHCGPNTLGVLFELKN